MSQKKYGRTFHLPGSPGVASDDKIMTDTSILTGCDDLIITEKMDGENTTIHAMGCHPRSPDARYHPSRDWMKAFAAGISPQLEEGERVIGEYLFARHSVSYDDLPGYFLGFALIHNDMVMSWDRTCARFDELGIPTVPLLYRGPWHAQLVAQVTDEMDFTKQEGFVMRTAHAFDEASMQHHIAKYVRAGHVQSEIHWMKGPVVKNHLA